jgi:hypothetical protein
MTRVPFVAFSQFTGCAAQCPTCIREVPRSWIPKARGRIFGSSRSFSRCDPPGHLPFINTGVLVDHFCSVCEGTRSFILSTHNTANMYSIEWWRRTDDLSHLIRPFPLQCVVYTMTQKLTRVHLVIQPPSVNYI